jgi:DNA-directed RNA polymerase subunit alpha
MSGPNNDAIETLDLSVRPYNLLMRYGITTVSQLLSLSRDEFVQIPHMTPRDSENIRQRVIACGFMDAHHPRGPFANIP